MYASKSSRPVLGIVIHPNSDYAGTNILLSAEKDENIFESTRILRSGISYQPSFRFTFFLYIGISKSPAVKKGFT